MRPKSARQRHATRWVSLAFVVFGTCSFAGCFEDGATLPEDYNTLKYRKIEISYNETPPEPYGAVRPLNGVHGAPLPVVPGDGDLQSLYWWLPNTCDTPASCPPDGAHLSMVRIGTDTLCDLSMESVFPNPMVSTSDIANYDVRALDDHMESARGVGDEGQTAILWQFGLNPGAGGFCATSDDDRAWQLGEPVPVCGDNACNGDEDTISCVADCGSECEDGACNGDETPESCPEDCLPCEEDGPCFECGNGVCTEKEKINAACVADCQAEFGTGDGACSGSETPTNTPLDCISNGFWKDAGVRILRHLNGDTDGDPKAKDFGVKFVEFMADPEERLGYTEGANFARLYDSYQDFARLVKTQTDMGWADKVNPDDPSDIEPVIQVGGIGYTIRRTEDLEFDSEAQKHPILRFIDSVAAESSATCALDCGNVCGDGVCNGSESSATCDADCGSTCGDGACNGDEDSVSCGADCAQCGDEACNGDEVASTCSEDCGPPCVDYVAPRDEQMGTCTDPAATNCTTNDNCEGDTVCEGYEEAVDEQAGTCQDTNAVCLGDAQCVVCGNGTCAGDEDAITCPGDCEALCGDGTCGGMEDAATCPDDCGLACGDDICTQGEEDTTTCHLDCGELCGDGVCNGDETAVSPNHPRFCLADCGPRCGNGYCGVPLDFLSFRTRTAHPHQAACIAARLRGYLDDKGLSRTKLLLAGVDPDFTDPQFQGLEALDDDLFVSTHLGAFQAAARIFLQSPLDAQACDYADVAGPADWMIAGRVPRVARDLADKSGEDPVALQKRQDDPEPGEKPPFIDSPFVEPNGAAKPAFMSLFPFRQVALNHQMVSITEGSDTQGMAILASQPPDDNGRVLHVIIANSNVHDGNADITYDLRLNNFVGTANSVEYKLAVLDRAAVTCSAGKSCEVHLGNPASADPNCREAQSPFTPGICQSPDCAPNCCDTSEKCGYASFQFSEFGVLETENNTLRFVQPMSIPSVHYIQFLKPN